MPMAGCQGVRTRSADHGLSGRRLDYFLSLFDRHTPVRLYLRQVLRRCIYCVGIFQPASIALNAEGARFASRRMLGAFARGISAAPGGIVFASQGDCGRSAA